MNVKPSFLDDWRTAQLVQTTGSVAAPLAVIRLWGYCQDERASRFPRMTDSEVAGICRWAALSLPGPCHEALIKAGFLARLADGGFEVPLFNELNANLITARANGRFGSKGGRKPAGYASGSPRVPVGDPAGTQRQATGNTRGTHGEPNRIEQNRTENPSGSPVPLGPPQDWGQD